MYIPLAPAGFFTNIIAPVPTVITAVPTVTGTWTQGHSIIADSVCYLRDLRPDSIYERFHKHENNKKDEEEEHMY